jgi:hypothetical protein
VFLIDGQVLRTAIDLAGTGEYDLDIRVIAAACLQNRQLGQAIDLEVREGIFH